MVTITVELAPVTVMLVVSSPTKALRSTFKVTVLGEVVLVLPDIGVTVSQLTEGGAMLQFTKEPVSPVFLIRKVSCELVVPKSIEVTGTSRLGWKLVAEILRVALLFEPLTVMVVDTIPWILLRSITAVTWVPLLALVLPDMGVNVSQSTVGSTINQSSTVPAEPTFFTKKVLVTSVSPKSIEPSLSCKMAAPAPSVAALMDMVAVLPAPLMVTDVDTMPSILLLSIVAITAVLDPPSVFPEVGDNISQSTVMLEQVQLSDVPTGPVFIT